MKTISRNLLIIAAISVFESLANGSHEDWPAMSCTNVHMTILLKGDNRQIRPGAPCRRGPTSSQVPEWHDE